MKLFIPSFIFLFLLSANAYASDVTPIIPKQPHSDKLAFKENKGQWYSAVKYLGEIPGGNIFLEQQGFTYELINGDDVSHMHPDAKKITIHGHIYKVAFLGSNPAATFTTENKSETYYNYFLGNNPEHWASDVHSYDAVTYNGLYPGIDMKVYGQNYTLKYDLTVHAGGDASAIQFQYNGMDKIYIHNDNLIIQTSIGKVVEVKPYSYQLINGVRQEVVCKYSLSAQNVLSFSFPDGYNQQADLIIDPQLVFSTYTGSKADNWGWTATYDDEGNLYLGGYVNELNNFNQNTGVYPTTTGAFQVTWHGGSGGGNGAGGDGIGFSCDMGITKFNSTGTKLIYSTLLGGSDNECPHSLFVNSANELCVYGETYSGDYPVTPGAYDVSYNGNADIAVTVFNSTGTGLIGSTYVGGSGADAINYDPTEAGHGNLKVNYGDNARGEILCDAQNNIYVATSTSSADFPTTPGCYQSTIGGQQDGCVIKLNPTCTQLIYSTFLGGSNDDAAYSIDLAADNSLYIAGGTMSSDFPSSQNGVNKNYLGGLFDGYVVHLNSTGTALLNTTFVGTSANDQVYGVKLDLNGYVYVVGNTNGAYPVTSGVYSNPNSGQFITKFSPDLSNVVYSTVFGNGDKQPNISPTAFLVDTCENVYVAGWGNSASSVFSSPAYGFDYPAKDMTNLPLTPDALQSTTDGTDFYIFVLKRDAQSLLYATYFGGNGAYEHVDGGTSRFDKKGVIYEAICASCGDFGKEYPMTDGGTPTSSDSVWSPTNKSNNCNELGLKIEMNFTKIKAVALATPAATGCLPLHVVFGNNSTNATQYFWSFGTGNPTDTSTLFSPSFTFKDTGTFNIMLVASDPNGCKKPDTAYTAVVVYNKIVTASVTDVVTDNCDSVIVNFTGTSTGKATKYSWNFGDSTHSSISNPTHVFHKPGTYTVSLIIHDSTACNGNDTIYKQITVQQRVDAQLLNSNDSGCAPLTITFNANIVNADTIFWNFGDGNTSALTNPTHTYSSPGTYQVSVLALSEGLCNHSDSAFGKVVVYPGSPKASFEVSANTVPLGTAITFINHSIGGDSYLWLFGDGDTATTYNAQHTYDSSGNFSACLVVNSGERCPDSICMPLRVEPPDIIGVPNAFTPGNKDQVNIILYVKGEGINNLLFKVFNRWGQKVFETNDLNVGWDGTFNGKPQEMDVYTWELFATFIDGSKVQRSGNVTLIR